jgi:hypothetical protein
MELYLAPSYRDVFWDFALDLRLKWDVDTGKFQSEEWERQGDLLRPLKRGKFSSRSGRWSLGLDVIDGRDVGSGNLVRNLSGEGEVDYVLPGFTLSWSDRNTRFEALVDRVVDPTVAAAALRRELGRLTVTLEGAGDPAAPVSYSGAFSDGRPVPASDKQITGAALEVEAALRDGEVLDIFGYLNSATLSSDAAGTGAGLRLNLDFSKLYTSRLSIRAAATRCTNGYIPAYFGALYPLWRWGGDQLPPAAVLASAPENSLVLESVELGYALGDSFRIKGIFERFDDDSLKRAQLQMQILEKGGRGLEAEVWSQARGDEELFDADLNLHSRISALYNFLPHLMVRADYKYSRAFREEAAGLVPLNSFSVGALYTLSL